MIILLILSIVIGTITAGLTGIDLLFWVVGGFVFICGLPGALITSFVHGEISYAQDREDYRQTMSDIKADELADEHEYAEDERVNRLVDAVKRKQGNTIYNDNRQIRLYKKDSSV
jgi:hypothetical protein